MLHRLVCDRVHRIEDAYVNWYIVEDGDALTIVDAGLPASWRSLQEALPAIGRRLDDVRAIVLTHPHFDHVGFAERLRRQLGITVHVPEGDRAMAAHPLRYPHERSPLRYAWRPGPFRTLVAMARAGAIRTPGVTSVATYRDGEVLDVPGRPVAIATPGHTPGHCSLELPDRGVLICGDALVTVDPYTNRSGPRLVARAATADAALAARSLDRIAASTATCLLPGHGPPFQGSAADAAERARQAGSA